jgi:hypothetical protein
MSVKKWIKFNKDAKDIPENILETMYEDVQKRFDSGLCEPDAILFQYGWSMLLGYKFFPISEKFLYKLVKEEEIEYRICFAKDKETCEKILNDYYSEDADFISLEVIKDPFSN